MTFNENYFIDGELWQLRPKIKAIHTYILNEGIIIAMFQGNRGSHPHLDFKIKILLPGANEKPFPPEHNLWVVDLLLKLESHKSEVKEIVEYYIEFYEKTKPFDTIIERKNYSLQTINDIKNKYQNIQDNRTLPISYIAIMLELFCICEKRYEGAYMFKNILQNLLNFINGNGSYITLMKSTKAGF